MTDACEIVEWIDPLGAITNLDVLWELSGRFMPGIEWEEEGVPDQPGSRFRSVRHGIHEFVLPTWIEADSESALRTELRALMFAMNPGRGVGRVRMTSALGDQREIWCRYADGLGLEEKLGSTSGPTTQRADIKFRAHDPYFYDILPVESNFVTVTSPPFFPFFPINLYSSEVVGTTSVDNSGDVETWPVWVITGPGSDIQLQNMTTGRNTQIIYSLAGGDQLTIDTRPGFKTVTLGDGTNVFPYLTAASALWPLIVGNNTVNIAMGGGTLGSLVQLSYRRRFLGP